MTDGSKYLAHILIKGLRGDYEPVISWLMAVYSASRHFSSLLKDEDQNAIMLLNALKGGMYSKNKEVCLWTLKVFNKIAYDLGSSPFGDSAQRWFVGAEGGLEGAVYALKKFTDVAPEVAELIVNISKGKLLEVYQTYFKT